MSPLHIDWHAMFTPTVGLAELFLRGSAMYIGVLLLMRILPRQKGALNSADMLVLIMIADAAQNGMSAEYNSLTEGAVLVGTLFFWNYALDKLAFHWPVFRHLFHEPPRLLVKDGQLQFRNMRQELLTRDDIYQQLREHGISDVREVRRCFLEPDGNFSVVKFDPDDTPVTDRQRGVP
ncbi:MAG TPA: YetF domain-containing protein [Gemmatimonas sp.]|uniref:DUF421 domain-containing protein n=1 Tax=Gemmatimonas sp. TaxID=1962908 RepID=UPI002ED7E1BC